jgi:superfamily I DNA/RNA helicase
MVARNNYLYNLSNGDLITVDSVEDKIMRMAGLEFKHLNIRVTDPDPEKGMIIKRVLINTNLLDMDARDLSAEQDMELLKNYFARMRQVALEIYDILNSVSDLDTRRKQLASRLKKNNLRMNMEDLLEDHRSKKELIRSVAYENMQTDPYLNALRVKYGYAITCHKAQGSEWPHVFVHLEKSMFYLDKENQHRWAYTALSRAEKKIHILNNICLY